MSDEPTIKASVATGRRVFLQASHPEYNGKTSMNAYLHTDLGSEEALAEEFTAVAQSFAEHSGLPVQTWSDLIIEAVTPIAPPLTEG